VNTTPSWYLNIVADTTNAFVSDVISRLDLPVPRETRPESPSMQDEDPKCSASDRIFIEDCAKPLFVEAKAPAVLSGE
jgi:hypothetical protein